MSEEETPKVVGAAKLMTLSKFQPNDWNPNEMTERQFESLKHGLQTDGWVASQALLVWGIDDKGVRRDIIIDGEHRWKVATELGFKRGPVVVLDGLTESQAKAYTVKMDARRGTFDDEKLAALVAGLEDYQPDNLALDLGLEDERMAKLLAMDEVVLPAEDEAVEAGGSGGLGTVQSKNAVTKMVPLYMDEAAHAAFLEKLKAISAKHDTANVTETVIIAVNAYKV